MKTTTALFWRAVIIYSLGWMPALGLMLAMWGNNIQTRGRR